MAIQTRDQLVNNMLNNRSRSPIFKNSVANTAAGQYFGMFRTGSIPNAGVAATAAAVCTTLTQGAIPFAQQTAPATSYLALLTVCNSVASSNLEIHDRLAHMGGLNGTLTTAQTVGLDLTVQNPGADRIGAADYREVQWWLEINTDLGATGVNATVNVTYSDGTTGNLSVIGLGATPRAGRMYQLVSASTSVYIRAINSVTLSATTGAAGNFGFVCTRQIFAGDQPIANKMEVYDWSRTGGSRIPNDACLMLMMLCTGTTTGAVFGNITIAHG